MLAGVGNVAGVVPARLTRSAIDIATGSKVVERPLETIFLVLCGVLVFSGLKALCMFLMRKTLIAASRHIERDLRRDLYRALLQGAPGGRSQFTAGDLLTRLSEDVANTRMWLGPAILYASHLLLLAVVVVGAMLMTSWQLTVALVLPVPFVVWFVKRMSDRVRECNYRLQEALSALTSWVQNSLAGWRTLKAIGAEEHFRERFIALNNQYVATGRQLIITESVFQPLVLLFIGVLTVAAVVGSGWLVVKGYATPGVIAEFVIYVNMLAWPLTSVGWIVSLVKKAEASARRLLPVLGVEKYSWRGTLRHVPEGEIRVDRVWFGYGEGIPVVKDLSLQVHKGEWILITGKEGSGKSTLLYLLAGHLVPQRGCILFDGLDYRRISIECIRSVLALVPQQPVLFSGTVRENLCLESNYADEELVEVLRVVELWDELASCLHSGLDTPIGQRGLQLSGGQRQRLSLARALLRRPRILLLDNVFASVDVPAEKKILLNMRRYLSPTTVIITAQRNTSAHCVDAHYDIAQLMGKDVVSETR